MEVDPAKARPRKQKPPAKRRPGKPPGPPAKLSPIQERFVQEYLLDLNATQAAIRAGYAESGAAAAGCNNLRRPAVAKAIAEAKDKRAKESEVDAAYVLQRLKIEAEREGEGSSHAARVAAIGLIGKHLGMFIDRIDVNQRQLHQVVVYLPDNKRDPLAGTGGAVFVEAEVAKLKTEGT